MKRDSKTLVVYVLGDAHCGSTLMSICLAHALGAVHGGELKYAPASAWLKADACSCGLAAPECPHWQTVRVNLADHADENAPVELAHLQETFDRLRAMPRALCTRLLARRKFRRYRWLSAAFLEALSEAGSSTVLVDNSKTVARALSLGEPADFAFRYIHITRDPRGSVWSLAKPKVKDWAGGIAYDRPPRAPWRAAAAWCFNNLASQVLGKIRSGRYMRIAYEDFVRAPDATLALCNERLGLTGGTLKSVEEEPLDPRPQHIIAGNRLRTAAAITIRQDMRWHEEMPDGLARKVWRMTGWLARHYGYRRELQNGQEPIS